jgi:hypothetical protein
MSLLTRVKRSMKKQGPLHTRSTDVTGAKEKRRNVKKKYAWSHVVDGWTSCSSATNCEKVTCFRLRRFRSVTRTKALLSSPSTSPCFWSASPNLSTAIGASGRLRLQEQARIDLPRPPKTFQACPEHQPNGCGVVLSPSLSSVAVSWTPARTRPCAP